MRLIGFSPSVTAYGGDSSLIRGSQAFKDQNGKGKPRPCTIKKGLPNRQTLSFTSHPPR